MRNDLGNNIGTECVMVFLQKAITLNIGRAKMG